MDRPLEYDTVTIDYPVDLRLVAECVNSTPDELQDLNPSLLRLTTPREGKFELHLPAGTKINTKLPSPPSRPRMRLWWRYHTVHSGDTLASLARTYRTTIKSIAEANHLKTTELEADAKLVIPVTPGKHPVSDTATYARRITRYKVHKGDTSKPWPTTSAFRRKCCAAGTASAATASADAESSPCTCQFPRARTRPK
jgi:membrane-bound lytic murein transglycosylase D